MPAMLLGSFERKGTGTRRRRRRKRRLKREIKF